MSSKHLRQLSIVVQSKNKHHSTLKNIWNYVLCLVCFPESAALTYVTAFSKHHVYPLPLLHFIFLGLIRTKYYNLFLQASLIHLYFRAAALKLEYIQVKYSFTLLEFTYKTSPVSPAPSPLTFGSTLPVVCESSQGSTHLIYIFGL